MLAPRNLLLLALSLLAPLAPAAAFQSGATQATPPAAKGEALLERVVVIGASLSAGFGLGKEDIDFQGSPEFSKAYLLRGLDEGAVRGAFTYARARLRP